MWRLLFVIILLSACTYKKAEIVPAAEYVHCDTLRYISYTGEIQAFLSLKCGSGRTNCHNNTAPTGFYLDTYEHVSNLVESGDFYSAITHAPGYTPMPYNLPALDSCSLATLLRWIHTGYPEN